MRMPRKILLLTIGLSLIGLCAWSPWITRNIAYNLAEFQFNQAWSGVIDGCGTSGTELGAKSFRRVPFGAYVTLDYQCGLVMPDEPVPHTKVFISFFGIAFGFPKP